MVRPHDGDPREAIILSPTPTSEQGAGFFVDPKKDTPIAVMRVGTVQHGTPVWHEHYALGYFNQYDSTGSRAGVMENIKTAEGDVAWQGSGQSFIKQSKLGTISLLTNLWSRLDLQQVTQTLNGFFRNLVMRFRGGKISWLTDLSYNSKLHAEIHDKYENDLHNDVTDGVSPNYANKVIIDGGNLPAGNLLDIETRQDRDGDNIADEFTKLSVGRPYEGALVEKTYTIDKGTQELKDNLIVDDETARTTIYTHGDNAASRSTTLDTKAGKVDVVAYDNETVTHSSGRGLDDKPLIRSQAIDGDSNTVLQEVLIDGSQMYKIDINNGKAKLEIDVDGNVTITSATGTILSGGTGKEQRLVTASFVQGGTAPYPMHTHLSSSPGAPTSPPMQPVILIPSDSLTNVATFTTKAE
jgi:hypothetical protein